MKSGQFLLLAMLCAFAQQAFCASAPCGRIVWWGSDFEHRLPYSGPTNGVIEYDGEMLTNVVAIAAQEGTGLALTSDGAMFTFGEEARGVRKLAVGLSKVASITVQGSSCWAIKRDGTVSRWGTEPDPDNVVAGLSNVTSITSAWGSGYLLLKKDGSVALLRLETNSADPGAGEGVPPPPHVEAFRIGGQILRNVAAISSTADLVVFLNRDGTVSLVGQSGYQIDPVTGLPLPPSLEPLKVAGQTPSNFVALAAGGLSVLALRSDGTVLHRPGADAPFLTGGGTKGRNESFKVLSVGGEVLSNVAAIVPGIALKQDGRLLVWGDDQPGLAPVPAGLPNAIAIAQAGWFSLALVAGEIPPSVYIPPHGRLEKMEREADLIFKGQVIASTPRTNSSLPDWGKPHASAFRLISILKGHPNTNELIFWHNTSGPNAWGGGSPPSWHQLEVGKSYLVFAKKLDKGGYLYTPPGDATNRPNEFRQLDNNGVTRTLDARPVTLHRVKDVHWFELNLMLTNGRPADTVYAIQRLNWLSPRCGQRWGHMEDFRRPAVLNAMVRMLTHQDESVAMAAIDCFRLTGIARESDGDWDLGAFLPASPAPECVDQLRPYAAPLLEVVNGDFSATRRAAAMSIFAGTRLPILTNWVFKWIEDPAEDVRAQAALLLPDFPGESCERALRERGADPSPVVRAAVADAIGNGKLTPLLPTLATLFSSSTNLTNAATWRSHKMLQGDGYVGEVSTDDIHSSAGCALLKFDLGQVEAILKTNLSDKAFGFSFIRKLASNGPEPYFPLLAEELKAHTAGSEQEAATNGFHWSLSHLLEGNYGWAWETLFAYVSTQTREALAAPPMTPILDALQIADDPGDPRTRSLYGLLLDKGMLERAIALRRGITRRTEDKAIDRKSFNFPALLKAFDEIDERHSLKPGLNEEGVRH